MTPTQTLYTYLDNSGLLSGWTDSSSTSQPGPLVQMRMLEEERAQSNERILLIKSASSGGGNRFVSDPVFTFAVIGRVGERAVYAEEYAELIYKELLKFTRADCVIGIDPIGRINGAYKMASGRPAYDMEFVVSVDSGVLV